MEAPDNKTSRPPDKTASALHLLLMALLVLCFIGLGWLLLTSPLPAPKTGNGGPALPGARQKAITRLWTAPRHSAMDLLEADWFKEGQLQREENALSPEQMNDELLGCWKYRNGRLASFVGSFAIRSVDPVTQTIKGFWNYDNGQALPLQGEYKISSNRHVFISVKSPRGDAYGQNLLLSKNKSTPCLCGTVTDPYKGPDFIAYKTSSQMRPTVPNLTERLQPTTVSLLVGRWHRVKAANSTDQPGFEIDDVLDDGTFSIKGAPYDGGFVCDGDTVRLYVGDQAYDQLTLGQTGGEITLKSGENSPLFAKEPGGTARTGKPGSFLSGMLNLIQQHNEP
jgi:hypothetical protein